MSVTNPNIGRKTYQWFVALLPLITGTLIVVQSQLRAREFDAWAIGDAAVGLIIATLGTLVAAQAGVARAGTEQAESNAEVVTGMDQDADSRVENQE